MSTTEIHYFDNSEMLPTADEKPTVFKGVSLSELYFGE